MLRFSLSIALTCCLTADLNAASLRDTVLTVSKTGFVLQTGKGPKSLKFSDYQLTDSPSPHGKVHDLLHRVRAADMREGMEVYVDYRTVAGEWVCKGIQPCPAQFDFKPLEKVKGKYTLHLVLVAADGTRLEKKYEIEAGSTFEAVRDQIQRSLQPVPPPRERWAVFGWGKNYLDIDGFIKGDKFVPIERITISSPELKIGEEPLVRQKGKHWPK
jgi:hypothetical protein